MFIGGQEGLIRRRGKGLGKGRGKAAGTGGKGLGKGRGKAAGTWGGQGVKQGEG